MQSLLVVSFSSPTPVAVIPGIVYPLSFWPEEHWRWHWRLILVEAGSGGLYQHM